MANPFVDIKNMLTGGLTKTLIGVVVSSANDKVKVELSAGNIITAWGQSSVGSRVVIRDGKVLGKVKKESETIVYIN